MPQFIPMAFAAGATATTGWVATAFSVASVVSAVAVSPAIGSGVDLKKEPQ